MRNDEAEYAVRRQPERLYFTKQFRIPDSQDERWRRFGMRVLAPGDRPEFAWEKGNVVLRTTPKGVQQIRARFLVDDRDIDHLVVQRFRIQDDRPIGETMLSLTGIEITRLFDLVRAISTGHLDTTDKVRIDEVDLDSYVLSDDAVRRFAIENPALIAEIVRNDLAAEDLISLAYRKAQLDRFEELLENSEAFSAAQAEIGRGPEAVWQQFFERNPWILGHGLTYVFNDPLIGKKLEQVVAGFSVAGIGKRVDALLRTRGFISSLCFAELKTHSARLTLDSPARPGVWSPSPELVAGIAQVQKTAQRAVEDIRSKLETRDVEGEPTGEVSYLYKPKSVLIIGNLREFQRGTTISEERYSSFELFRRSVVEPEVVTFDELLERARSIVRATSRSA